MIMKHHKYLIVGGGMAADSAIHGIRQIDQDGAIAMICEERHPPYDRPPLSKALWKGTPYESIWRNEHGLNVALHLGKKIVALDAKKRRQAMMPEIFIRMKSCCSPRAGVHVAFRSSTGTSSITGRWTTIGSCGN